MQFVLVKILAFITIIVAPVANSVATSTDGAVILMYHHFGEARYPSTNISLQQFDSHLDYLEKNNFQVWSLERIIKQLNSQQPFPGKVVAITIDDAYRSVYSNAYPRLKQRRWPFTVFVSTDTVDKKMPAFMSWDQMREMQQHGATFANHSSYHDFLIEHKDNETASAWQHRIRRDLQHAQQRLQRELGTAPALFAYPYGEYNLPLQQIVKELGWTAFGQQSGVVSRYSDRLALPRYPMAEQFATLAQFRTKVMSLPMPIITSTPSSPVLGKKNPPMLQLTLADNGDIQLDQLNCFASNQGPTSVRWLDKVNGRFTVEARQPFDNRRNRYNCTAPSRERGRYYWYSQLWIQSKTASN